MIHPRISRREWRNVILFALLVLLLITLPYVAGAAAQRDNWRFGWFMFGVDDGNSYLAKMREGAVGGWLFHIAYTSEPHDGALLFTPYLAAGKLATIFAAPSSPAFVDAMLVIFHVSRLLFDFLLILILYRFIAAFLVKRSLRWLALILVTLGGGFGWLLILLNQANLLGSLPVDFFLPEGYSFLVLYGLPHVALARAAMFGGLLLIFAKRDGLSSVLCPFPSLRLTGAGVRETAQNLASHWLPYSFLAGVCWLIMGLCVPFYIVVIYAILGVWGLAAWIRSRRFPIALFVRCATAALIPLPYLIYNLYVFATNPVLGIWSAQNSLPSPHPLHYVLGYGLLAILALPAIRWAWRRGRRITAYLLLPAWVIAGPVFVYLPINVQRRLLEGIFVPLCILAVMGLRLWWIGSGVRRYPRRAHLIWREAVIMLLILTLPSTLILLFSGIQGIGSRSPANRLFHTSGEIAALDWLNTHAAPDSVVLSSFTFGNYLPARASLRAFIGHGPETLYLGEKSALADRFYAGHMADRERLQFFKTYRIRYVIFQPDQTRWIILNLLPIYDHEGYSIYEVGITGAADLAESVYAAFPGHPVCPACATSIPATTLRRHPATAG